VTQRAAEPRLFLGETDAESADLDLPQGQVSVSSFMSPDKTTGNEE